MSTCADSKMSKLVKLFFGTECMLCYLIWTSFATKYMSVACCVVSVKDEEEEHVPPVLGRKYTAPLNILNDLSKEERVCIFI